MRRRQIIYLGIILIVAVIASVSYYSYAFFTAKTEQHGKLNIITGTLDYQLQSDDLVNNCVEIEANATKNVTFKVKSLNEIDSKYKLYYDSNKVKVKYADGTTSLADGTIATNEEKIISVVLENKSDEAQCVKFGVEGGFTNNEIVLGRHTEHSITEVASPFATDSWDTILNNIRNGNADIYAPVSGGLSAQSLKAIDLGELGTHYLKVVNTTPCTNGETSETACGFVIEFADQLEKQAYNTTNTTVGGYASSNVFNYINNRLLPILEAALPENVVEAILPTTVVSGHSLSDATCDTSLPTRDENCNYITENQKIYLLGYSEMTSASTTDTAKSATRLLDYYSITNNRPFLYGANSELLIIRTTRSVSPTSDNEIFGTRYINNSYNSINVQSNSTVFPALAFRIG